MSTELPPPPPPGFEDTPPPPTLDPAAVAHIPPPAEGEGFETDVLKRHAKFSWKNFGGDGFLVSVAVHVLLAIIGVFYVISKYTEPPKKPEDIFSSGAGGGNGGEKAKNYEHKMKSQRMMVTMPSRIVSKSANAAIALPSTPNTSTASFSAGLSSGGVSKGSGGGAGGGEGTGIGIGKGGGRQFTSLFGARGLGAVGLTGTFYDAKQTPTGGVTKYTGIKGKEVDGNLPENSHAANEFVDEVLAPFSRTWDPTKLAAKFFTAPEQLVASQIFIPACGAGSAPEAYGVGDKVKGSRWLAHYKGAVLAPKSGKFRFWGLGDDVMVVRWEGKNTLDSGWTRVSLPGRPNLNNPKVVLGMTAIKKGNPGAPFRASRWIEVTRGREYPIEIFISEVPGGLFGGWLMMEEWDESKKDGDGKIFLFRMSPAELPEGLKDDTGLGVDLSGKGLIWTAKSAKKTIR